MNIGYCTNIHCGVTFDEALANLNKYALPIKRAASPNRPMGIGLWFSQLAANEALKEGNWQRLREFLDENRLVAHTFNAFPFSDFHQPVVKHLVYEPDWTNEARKQYSLDVARLMSRLLPEGSIGTISTLPLGWSNPECLVPNYFRRCTESLTECAKGLAEIQQDSGVTIRLCLEPEPGCSLQTSDQVQMVFQWYLFADSVTETGNRQFLGVCHDVCHAAVMFESQTDVLTRYYDAGIAIGKVQISSAIELDTAKSSVDGLKQFVEPRYLHQTNIKTADTIQFFEDLPLALEQADATSSDSAWRTHFHIPIMLKSTGSTGTTQSEIKSCLDWFIDKNYETQFEVETYAWEVSPDSIQSGSMVASIVAELQWLENEFPDINSLNKIRQ